MCKSSIYTATDAYIPRVNSAFKKKVGKEVLYYNYSTQVVYILLDPNLHDTKHA